MPLTVEKSVVTFDAIRCEAVAKPLRFLMRGFKLKKLP